MIINKLKPYILLIFLNVQVIGQNNYIGFSFAGGYKSVCNELGLDVCSRLVNHIDINFGYARGKFDGDGFSTGIGYSPLKFRLQPFVGVQYLKTFGRQFNLIDEGKSTEFKTTKCEFYYYKAGIMYSLDLQEKAVENLLVLLTLTVSFRNTTYSNYHLNYISGDYPYKFEKEVNQRIGKGYGFNISLIILFGKEREYDPNFSDPYK